MPAPDTSMRREGRLRGEVGGSSVYFLLRPQERLHPWLQGCGGAGARITTQDPQHLELKLLWASKDDLTVQQGEGGPRFPGA